MDPRHRLSPRARLLRIAAGLGLIGAGCVIYYLSEAHDPGNRWAILAILAVLIGSSWLVQGIRGRRDGAVHEEEIAPSPPRATPLPIPLEKSVFGLVLAWIVPGAGHWLVGRRAKGVLYFATITATFVVGALLAEGRCFPYEPNKVYYLAYVFNAGETGLAWLMANHLQVDKPIRFLQLGFLYTAVASLLNVVAMMDFVALTLRPAEPAPATEPDAVATSRVDAASAPDRIEA